MENFVKLCKEPLWKECD